MDTKDRELKENVALLIKNTDMFVEADADRLAEQVKGHKYFLDRQLGRDVSLTEVAFSWMENVYLPISEAMETFTTSASFPVRSAMMCSLHCAITGSTWQRTARNTTTRLTSH